jgi:hypothetical protein
MCFNFHASLAAFLIGETTGLLLAQSYDRTYRNIGLFVMFFTLVQLLEALVYKGGPLRLLSLLLQTNLGAQGLVFFALVQPWSLSFWICLGISLFVTLDAFRGKHFITMNGQLRWNMTPPVEWALRLMFLLIFVFSLRTPAYKLASQVILGMLVVSYVFGFFYKRNNPSLWCLASAIGSPVLLFLK